MTRSIVCGCEECHPELYVPPSELCACGCGSQVDPTTCQCGNAISKSGSAVNCHFEGHTPVPMGCTGHLKYLELNDGP